MLCCVLRRLISLNKNDSVFLLGNIHNFPNVSTLAMWSMLRHCEELGIHLSAGGSAGTLKMTDSSSGITIQIIMNISKLIR